MKSIDVTITIFLIAAGGFFAVYAAIAHLTIKGKKNINYLLASLFFLYGFSVLCDTTYRVGTENLTPHLLYINYTLLFFMGPIIFFYFMMLVYEKIKLHFLNLLLFVPGIFSLIFFFPYYISDASAKLAVFPLNQSPSSFIRVTVTGMEYVLLPWLFFCFVLFLRYTYFMRNKTALIYIKNIRMILIYITLWILLGLFLSYSDIVENIFLYRITLLCSNTFVFFLFANTIRHPDFFRQIKQDILKAGKYKRSHITGLDSITIIKKIERMMQQDTLYTNNKLTLKKLSGTLLITSHQLSEIINVHFNANFNRFINKYRIEAARKMLIEQPETTILEIAFNCGFNSKTTFNTSFLKQIGVSPSDFRKMHSA